MVNVFKRLATSKKSWLVSIALLGDLGATWGLEVPVEAMTSGFLLWWNVGVLGLTAVQGAIDAVHGSPSDANGTGS